MSEMSITIFWRACFHVRGVFVWTFEALPQVGCFFFHTEAKICMNQMVSPKRGELVQLEIHLTWWPCRVVGGHLLAEPGRLLLSPLCPLEFGTNGKCGEAWAGWRALCYPSSPCLPLSLQSTSHSESNTEAQRRDASRLCLIFQLELFEAVSLIHPSRPDSE